MRPFRLALLPLVLLALGAIFANTGRATHAAPQADGPKTLLTTGLLNPRGIKVGPDGMLYVAEAGSGGTTTVTTPDMGAVMVGNTGRISKINPTTGERTTVLDGLPSAGAGGGDPEADGTADVAFLDNTLYYLTTGNETIFPGHPAGIYKLQVDGTTKLFANLGAFTKANPVETVKNGSQADVDESGNPYAMIVRDRSFYVVDGNQNQVLAVTETGAVSRLVDFGIHIVTTGIASQASGPLFVATLGEGPFLPEDGRVYQVGFPTGTLTQIASGVSSLTGLAFGPGGKLYAQSFGDTSDDPNGPPWIPGTGRILKVNGDGTFSTITSGFSLGTTFTFIGDTAYVLNDSVNAFGTGEIWKVPNFSSIQPGPPIVAAPTAAPAPTEAPPAPAPRPEPTRPVGITAPNTGSGPSPDTVELWAIALAAAALGACSIAASVAARRR